jgi:DNA-binding IclR family transcriptional regulator
MTATPHSSVDQVFDVLEVLSASADPTGVAQLARALNVPTSTAHRVLATIETAGYATRDTTGTRYQLGLGAQELTHALLRRFPLQAVCQPSLRGLAVATGETTVLTCRIGWYGLRVASVEGWREIHAAPRLAETSRLDATAGGRALLGFVDDQELSRFLKWSAASRRQATAIRAEVASIRERGYVLDEATHGRSDLALPVRAGDMRVVAAVTVEASAPGGGARAERQRYSQAAAVVKEIEDALLDPALSIDPFGHLDPDDLDPGSSVTARTDYR